MCNDVHFEFWAQAYELFRKSLQATEKLSESDILNSSYRLCLSSRCMFSLLGLFDNYA